MGNPYFHLIVEAAIWLASLIGGIVAISVSRCPSAKRLVWSFVLAVAALIIGYLGFFTPFSFWPRIASSWTNGEHQIAIDLNRFFGAPLAFGAVALGLALSRTWKLRTAGQP